MGLIRGAPYPIVQHPKGFLHSSSDEIDQIKSNMLQVLLTKPGERLFEPGFGIDINKVDPKQPLPIKTQQLRRMVAMAIKRWEPRVQLKDVRVDTHDNAILGYTVIFHNPLNLQKLETLTVNIL